MPIHSELSIDPALRAGAAILQRASESVRAVTAAEENRFTRAFEALNRLANASGTPLAVVGGLAAIHFGYPAVTEVIDVVVPRDALERLLDEAPKYGLKVKWRSKLGWHTLAFEDVEINVVPEGGRARDAAPTAIPGPNALGVNSGLAFSSLPGWVELKLSSGRTKDRTHIVEVLKILSPEQIAGIERHIEAVHAQYAATLRQLIEAARAEKDQESDRGKDRG